MTHEEAVTKARTMLETGYVAGVSRPALDVFCQPSNERVAELAALIESGAVDADARIAEVE